MILKMESIVNTFKNLNSFVTEVGRLVQSFVSSLEWPNKN